MLFPAVQHERAPRPLAPHQIALQKLGYTFTRHPSFVPSPAPLTFSAFPSLHSHSAGGMVPGLSDTLPNAHNSFLDRNSFQDFAMSRIPDTVPDVPLIGSHVNALSSLSSFKIPLFSTPLHYPVSHPGYFPTNIFYPSVISSDLTSTVDSKFTIFLRYFLRMLFTCNRSIFFTEPMANGFSSVKAPTTMEHRNFPEKPDSQLSGKIKEDEVSSSEEAFKADGPLKNKTEEGKLNLLYFTIVR